MINNKLAIIGGGNMGRAIARGLIRGGMHSTDLCIAEPGEQQCELLRKEFYGALVTSDNETAAKNAEILLFAVKPQILKSVCRNLSDLAQSTKPLIISIAAGSRADDIDSWLGGKMSIVRVMPNQPAMIDQSISALYANTKVKKEYRSLAENVMSSVGQFVWIDDESQMDAVTALSGTGPAYFYLLIDIMIESGIKYGLEPDTARTLAVETARGATALAATETESMAKMIDRVRSPGGTTMAAFKHLDSENARGIFEDAIETARHRSAELAKENN